MYSSQLMVERVKNAAKEKGIGILKLQELCGLSVNAISQAGKSAEGMKAKNLYAIAEILDCSVDYLLGRSDTLKIEPSAKQNDNHGLNMGIIEYSPAISLSVKNEQQQEINAMLRDLTPRERTELMMMIYTFHDEHTKKGNK